MTRKPEDIRKAIDTTLSGASHDPTLYFRVVNASKGDTPTVKRKLTFSMALVLILVLMTSTVAVAATYRGVSWFLTEHENQTVDPDYLMDILEQTHDSELLNIRVVDAYWDGAKLSIAINFTPKDAALSIDNYCYHYGQPVEHKCRNESADLLLDLFGDHFPNITAGTEVTRPYCTSYDRYHEEDGSLTAMIAFGVNDMSQPVAITLPFRTVLRSTGEIEDTLLHFYLPVMADPIAPHEHDWEPATCVSPKFCRICGRTYGKLGEHDFSDATCIAPKTCHVCTVTIGTLSLHHQYGSDGHCILCGKYYQHADKTK